MNYQHMTNPEIVRAIAGLDEAERGKALNSLSKDQRKAVEGAISASVPYDGARAAVLERLGREKQINDSQAWTADGISPNSALVTEAVAAKFTEAKAPESVIEDLVADTQAKASGDVLAAAGKDTSATLSSEDVAANAEGDAEAEDAKAEDSADTGKKLKGKLPEGFPGKGHLEAAGVTTYAQVRKLRDGEGLTSVANIGDSTASQIEEAIKE